MARTLEVTTNLSQPNPDLLYCLKAQRSLLGVSLFLAWVV